MKHLNCPVSEKLNPSFSSAETTRIRRSENLNLKQRVNQSTPEVLPMLTGFVTRYNQPASYWTSYLWKLLNKLFVKAIEQAICFTNCIFI